MAKLDKHHRTNLHLSIWDPKIKICHKDTAVLGVAKLQKDPTLRIIQ